MPIGMRTGEILIDQSQSSFLEMLMISFWRLPIPGTDLTRGLSLIQGLRKASNDPRVVGCS